MEDPNFDGRSTKRTEREWPSGAYGQDWDPPKMVKDWRGRKDKSGKPAPSSQPIDFTWEKSQGVRIINSLKTCTQQWVIDAVKKRRTLEKQDATDSAQAIFAADRHGKLNDLGQTLRDMRLTTGSADDLSTANSGLQDRQADKITTWINSSEEEHAHVTKESRTVLVLHCSITAEELAVLAELHRVYDISLCHFMKHILSPNFARYVNALRLKAETAGDVFGWREHEKAVLDQLVDSAEPNDIIDFQLRIREEAVPCHIWIAERASERKLLEEDGVRYSELTWLSYVLHMVTNDERRVLEVPADNLLDSYSMDKLALSASKADPKSFRIFKHQQIHSSLGKRVLHIHRLLKADKNSKKAGSSDDKRSNDKEKKANGENNNRKPSSQDQSKDRKKSPSQIKALELPTALPQKDGKPDKAVYDKLTEGKTRQRVWQRIEDGSCIRCGSSEHTRSDCPKEEVNWEKDFNKGKTFWEKPKYQQRVQCDGSDRNLLLVEIPECYLLQHLGHSDVCVGIDTLSSVNTCVKDLLIEVKTIPPVEIEGTGGFIEVAEFGYLPVHDSASGQVLKLPFFAVSPSQLPTGCSCIIGLPTVRKYCLSVDDCIAKDKPHLSVQAKSNGQITMSVTEGPPSAPDPAEYGGPHVSNLTLDDLMELPATKVVEDVSQPRSGADRYYTDCNEAKGWNILHFLFLAMAVVFSWTAAFSTPTEALLPGNLNLGFSVFDKLETGGELLAEPLSIVGCERDPLFSFDDSSEHFSDPPIQFVQNCSFRGGRALRATGVIRDHVGAAKNIEISVDSASDVNMAIRELLTDVHPVRSEQLKGVGGSATIAEEGNLTVILPSGETAHVPAIVADSSLPINCKALLGSPGIDDLNIDLNAQKSKQRQPLQCNLSEKKLRAWWDVHKGEAIETKPFDADAVDINPELPENIRRKILNTIHKFLSVFEGSKGSLPKPFKTDPVELNFVKDCTPSSVPEPKWSYGFGKVVEKWAIDGIASGLLEPSQSEWSSRPHIVLKPPPGVHSSEAPISDCKLRVVGDYRLVNKRIAKLVPNLPTGTVHWHVASH